ncbi:hypothetical protein GDO78_003122 [Eleutherodactylus coqui]|uniref:Uncharacterized protein n=1 Tax=Eleutherodactylus coqui TaxID=57060 RepID=A0A8J6K0D3_ELECQ|nr:hypothetical protein GDO78_003122 [Eleutherodactylus coqui]
MHTSQGQDPRLLGKPHPDPARGTNTLASLYKLCPFCVIILQKWDKWEECICMNIQQRHNMNLTEPNVRSARRLPPAMCCLYNSLSLPLALILFGSISCRPQQ